MLCAECQNLLSEFIDGQLPERKRLSVQTHLERCERCEALRDDLAQIVEASAQLPLHTPSSRVWARIEREIAVSRATNGAGFANVDHDSFWKRLAARRFTLAVDGRQAFAAAAAAVVLAGTVGVVSVASPDALPRVTWGDFGSGSNGVTPTHLAAVARPADRSYENLTRLVARQQQRWTPEMLAAYRYGLAACDARVNETARERQQFPDDAVRADRAAAAEQDRLHYLEQFSRVE